MKTDYIKPSIYKKIYQVMEYENALALRVSLETGLRIGDVLSLTPANLVGNTIKYTAQKTGKPGKKVISSELSKRLRQISSKKFIFPGRFGDKPRTRQTVWKDVKKATKHLKITDNVGCHSARKTYAVDLFHEKGLPEVQKELQHDRMDTTMIYAFSDMLSHKKDCEPGNLDYDLLSEMIADRVYRRLLPLFEQCSIDKSK
jgi:integrase